MTKLGLRHGNVLAAFDQMGTYVWRIINVAVWWKLKKDKILSSIIDTHTSGAEFA
jgi:hypothetical protein